MLGKFCDVIVIINSGKLILIMVLMLNIGVM